MVVPEKACGDSRDCSLEESTCFAKEERDASGEKLWRRVCWGAGEGQTTHWRPSHRNRTGKSLTVYLAEKKRRCQQGLLYTPHVGAAGEGAMEL